MVRLGTRALLRLKVSCCWRLDCVVVDEELEEIK